VPRGRVIGFDCRLHIARQFSPMLRIGEKPTVQTGGGGNLVLYNNFQLSGGLMTDVRVAAFGGETSIAQTPARTRKRAGYIHRLVEALHFSRRLHAESVVRQYRHLINEISAFSKNGSFPDAD
jgi:hypothetical protein